MSGSTRLDVIVKLYFINHRQIISIIFDVKGTIQHMIMSNDFEEKEKKKMICDFKKINFECCYVSFNMFRIKTNYKGYTLTVHKRGEHEGGGYYFFIYRPSREYGMSINSRACQQYLGNDESCKTIKGLVNYVKNIRSIIFENSVVMKDICQDMLQTVHEMSVNSNYVSTDEFLPTLKAVITLLNKLSYDVAMKKNRRVHDEMFDEQEIEDIINDTR
jgi:hypothetical protein